MTQINGRWLRKTVEPECPTCHGTGHLSPRLVLDYDAYWMLDYEGNEDRLGGTWLYDRVAWPTLRDAQRKHLDDQADMRARFNNSKMGQYLNRQRALRD